MTEQSLNHWAAYWQSGARHSLPEDFSGNYDREVATFWASHFGSLPAGGRMLDLCTGSGAIPLLAHQYLGKSASITAVDGAPIDVDTLAFTWKDSAEALDGIEFLFDCPVESLAPDRCPDVFDLVTSQYGLEYCDLVTIAPILFGLIKPGGRLVMVTHGANSKMASTMAEEAGEYRALEEVGYFKVLASWSKNQLSGQDLAKRLTRIVSQLMSVYQKTSSPLIGQVIESTRIALAGPVGQLMGQRALAGAYLAELQAARQRLIDMQHVTEKLIQGSQWLLPLQAQGLVLKAQGELYIDGQHFAGLTWVLEKPI